MTARGQLEFFSERSIIDVLGRSRPIEKVWPDGSYTCPFCASAVCVDRVCVGYVGGCDYGVHCANPACFANPHYPAPLAREKLAEHERHAAEEAERRANHASAMRIIDEDRAERARQCGVIRAIAEAQGCCVRCALHDAPYRVKYIKHRKACPRDR